MKNKAIRNDEYYIAVFSSKNYAIQLFYSFEKKGFTNFNLISTPCQLQGGCSYSLKFNNIDDYEILKNDIELRNLQPYKIISGIYHVTKKEGRRTFQKLNNII